MKMRILALLSLAALAACEAPPPFIPLIADSGPIDEALLVRPLDPSVGDEIEWGYWTQPGDAVHFDRGSPDLKDTDLVLLEAKVTWLRRHPDLKVIVEGHADDRGAKPYNVDLGRRRAEAAAAFMVNAGIGESRIRIASKGKEDPVCGEKTEPCRAANRQAVFLLLSH